MRISQNSTQSNRPGLVLISNESSDWVTHQHRDTLTSIVGHPTLTSYLAIADGEAIGRVKFEMTEVCDSWHPPDSFLSQILCWQQMLQPCGPPPRKADD